MFELIVRLDELANFIPVLLGHNDIAEHDVRLDGPNLVDGLLPVSDGVELEILIGERELDNLLNRDAVVGEQDLVSHRASFRLCEFERSFFRYVESRFESVILRARNSSTRPRDVSTNAVS